VISVVANSTTLQTGTWIEWNGLGRDPEISKGFIWIYDHPKKKALVPYDSPNKAQILEKPSIASTSLYQFGGEQMIKAQWGVLEWQSLEDNCLSAEGEEILGACEFFLSSFSIMILY
jgi:hypothetical protein